MKLSSAAGSWPGWLAEVVRAGVCAGSSRAGPAFDHDVPVLGGQLGRRGPHPAELRVQHGGRDGHGAGPVALAAQPGVGVEQHGHGGQARAAGLVEVAAAAFGIQAQGVDDGGQAAAGARGHDLIQQREGVGRGVQVTFAAADHGPEPIGGHHLGGPVVRGGPG